MYKLNIKRAENGQYTAIVKQRFFKKLWLTIARGDFPTKKECKQFYKIVAY